jgi:hypothetical protein
MELQAAVGYEQGRLEEARSEAMHATDVYGKLGAKGVEECREFAQRVQEELNS